MKKTKMITVKGNPVVYTYEDGYMDLVFYGEYGAVCFYGMGSRSSNKKTIAEFTKLRDLIDVAIDDMTASLHNSKGVI